MKKAFFHVFLLLAVLVLTTRCKEESTVRMRNQQKALYKEDEMVAWLQEHWQFKAIAAYPSNGHLMQLWPEWRALIRDLGRKPQSNIQAFRDQIQLVLRDIQNIQTRQPMVYTQPFITARITQIRTEMNMLGQYIQLKPIPQNEVALAFDKVNQALDAALYQIQEWDTKQRIPMEAGENDWKQMKDSTRAIQ